MVYSCKNNSERDFARSALLAALMKRLPEHGLETKLRLLNNGFHVCYVGVSQGRRLPAEVATSSFLASNRAPNIDSDCRDERTISYPAKDELFQRVVATESFWTIKEMKAS